MATIGAESRLPRTTTVEVGGRSPQLRELLWASLLYTAMTVVLAYPLSIHSASRLLWMGADSELFAWTLQWNAHALATHPLTIFDANIFHPQRLTLAYTENLIGSSVVSAPVLWLTGNPVLAINLVALVSCVLCGLGTYVLARRVGLGPAAAALAGIVFTFSPARFGRLGQLHLTTVQWMPFALASLHAYLDEGRRRDLWLATGLMTLQAWTSGHGAVFLLLAMGALVSWRFMLGGSVGLGRRLRDFGIPGLLLLLPLVPLILAYRAVQQEIGLRRPLDPAWWTDWWHPALSYIASPAHLPRFVLSHFVGLDVIDSASGYLFPGLLPLLLAAAALASRRAWTAPLGKNVLVFYAALALGTLWLSAGAPIGPWPWLYALPGLTFIRVPARFTILSLLALSIPAGFGFERLSAALAPRWRKAGVLALGAAMAAEFAMIPLATVPYRLEIPEADRWLATQPKPFVVAEIPFMLGHARDQTTFMLHSTVHWQRTVNGYSGFTPPLHEALLPVVRMFPSEESLAALKRLGVNYVVVHPEFYRNGQWPAVQDALAKAEGRIRLVHTDGENRVYALR